MRGRHLLFSVLAAVAVATSLSLGTVQVAAATSCRPTPGSEACLSYLFADGGAHFSTKVWQADIEKAEGTTPALNAKFERLIKRAKTQAEKTKIDHWFFKAIHGGGTQPGSALPSWTTVNRVCRQLETSAGYTYHVSICRHWWAGFGVVTSWQAQIKYPDSQITIMGYLPRARVKTIKEIATFQFPKRVPMPDTAAWTAVDSPLPLIAWFRTERSQHFDPGMVHLQYNSHPTLGDNESISAAQFLQFWGYGYAPVVFSSEVRHLMADVGFNPIMAGGPDVPNPAKAWPAWTSRALDPKALRAAGWLYTTWPEIAVAQYGLPGLYTTGVA